MYIEDLTKLDLDLSGDNIAFAVGWLHAPHEYSKGFTSDDFKSRLREICSRPIRITRGFHECSFCEKDRFKGNGEVRVGGRNGKVFVGPTMISHYVDVHDYHPPEEFIKAVIDMSNNNLGQELSKIARSVFAMADSPTEESRDIFYGLVKQCRLGIRVPHGSGSVPPGEYVTKPGSGLSIPLANSPSGDSMLLVLADVSVLSEQEPGTTFVEFASEDVLKMAQEAGAGVIVQVIRPERQAWAGIPKEDVNQLLHAPVKRKTEKRGRDS